MRRGSWRTRATLLEGAGFGQIETPIFEDTELFVRTVGEATDIVRKEMYTFTDRSGPLADAAAGGHGAGLPRLHRARHAQASAAGEALVHGADVPLRGAAGRAATASTARSAPRRSAPTTPRSTRELIDLLGAPLRAPRPARRAAAPDQHRRRRDARASTRASCATSCSPRRLRRRAARPDRDQPDARLRLGRARDRGRHRSGAEDARPALDRGPRALRRGAAAARRGRRSTTSSTRGWCAGSTTTRARCSSSAPTRSAPRAASAAAAATTG